MKIGAFDVHEPLPNLNKPHAIAVLRPWIDAGNVGTLVLSRLEVHFRAREMARLSRPGYFFDFTRYRPTMNLTEGQRQVSIPNTTVTYAKRDTGNDFVFLHLLEPHMLGEVYVDSVLQLLRRLGVSRYCLVGSMYDAVPHTRPLIVSGAGIGKSAQETLQIVGVQPSDYQGPTTILYLISQRAAQLGIEVITMVVHLPQYANLENDHMGEVRLMEIFRSLYGIPVEDVDIRRAEEQHKRLDVIVGSSQEVKEIVTQLEAHYDARAEKSKDEETPQLSPEVERFLREMDRQFGTE